MAVRCQRRVQLYCVTIIVVRVFLSLSLFFIRKKKSTKQNCSSRLQKPDHQSIPFIWEAQIHAPLRSNFFSFLACVRARRAPIPVAGYIILSTSRLSTYRINNASVKPITWRRPQINSSHSSWISHGWLNWFSTVKWSSNKQASPTWKGSDSHQNLNSL